MAVARPFTHSLNLTVQLEVGLAGLGYYGMYELVHEWPSSPIKDEMDGPSEHSDSLERPRPQIFFAVGSVIIVNDVGFMNTATLNTPGIQLMGCRIEF